MAVTKTKHHADIVGSLLRPNKLIEARQAMRARELTYPEFRAIEDEAVDDAIKLQEDAEMLNARIEEAAQFHPKENLGISTQCGFASTAETAEDRKITEQTQTDKLKLIVDVASEVW